MNEGIDMSRHSRPHPYLAGLLGLIPGVGHLYLGRYRTAGYELIRFAVTVLPLIVFHFDPVTTLPWAIIPYVTIPAAYVFSILWVVVSSLEAYHLAKAMTCAWTPQTTATLTETASSDDSSTAIPQQNLLTPEATCSNCGQYLDPDPAADFCPWCGTRPDPTPEPSTNDPSTPSTAAGDS